MKTQGRRIALATGAVAFVVLALAVYLGFPHLRFWYRFQYLGPNEKGFPEHRHRQTGIVMVRLPGGQFWMGAQKTDPDGRNYDPEAKEANPFQGEGDDPVHEVTLSPFLIAKHEVTQAEWKAVRARRSSCMNSLPANSTSLAMT